MNESFESETCKKIFDLLSINSGLTLDKIANILDLEISVTDSYLKFMEKRGEIIAIPKAGKTQYYIKQRGKGTRESRSSEIRKRIFDILSENPGLNLTAIAEKVEMSAQLAEYHLLFLERNNLVTSIKEKGGYYKRYYAASSEIGVREKKIVALLRQENILRIVLLLLKKPNMQHKVLSDILDIKPSTLSHHISRLEIYDVIEVVTHGREKGYKIKNKKEIISIIRRFVTDIITEGFNEMWDDLNAR